MEAFIVKIKNGEIEFYSTWILNNLSLSGKRSRMRMKFLSILDKQYVEFRKYHIELLKDHCSLDEVGNPKVVKKDSRDVFDIIDEEKFHNEYMELALEEFTIEENDQNKEMLIILKTSIEECETEFIGQAALDYEHVCVLFDRIYGQSE